MPPKRRGETSGAEPAKRRRWTPDEEAELQALVGKLGPDKWPAVAQRLAQPARAQHIAGCIRGCVGRQPVATHFAELHLPTYLPTKRGHTEHTRPEPAT